MPFRLAGFLLLGAVLCFGQAQITVDSMMPAQQLNPNAKRYTVTGVVVNSITNEPIRRALVHLQGPEPHVAFTGPDGRFEFQNVPEGHVFLMAQRPGYSCRFGTVFQVGSASGEVRVTLTPDSRITGTVTDNEGEPVEGIAVQILRAQIVEGHKRWVPGGGASTDENGEYKIEDQQPGAVIVCTTARPIGGVRNAMLYPSRCYPNASDSRSAQEITVAAGQAAQADFSIDPVKGYNIAGTVVGGDGSFGAWIEGPGGMLGGVGMRLNPRTHGFVLGPVTNGTWTVHVQNMNGRRGVQDQAEQEVTVNGADVTGLQVVLAPPVDVPIEFIPAASSAGGEETGQVGGVPVVRLRRSGESSFSFMSYFPMAVPDPNATPGAPRQIIKNVSPGSYNVSVSSTSACIGSVVSGGVDLLQQPLTIAPGSTPQPITVTLRNDCASLDVALHSDHPENSATLLLVPETPGLEATLANISGQTSFSFMHLTPGSYRVYAAREANNLEYANPDAMRDIPGQTVTLDAGQKATVTLTVAENTR